MNIVTVGIDLAKTVFALHGVDQSGKAVFIKPKVIRRQLLEMLAQLPPCLLVMGARSILAGLGEKQDRFSRWARSLVERLGCWKAAVAIAAKNLRLTWAMMKYGEDFRLTATAI